MIKIFFFFLLAFFLTVSPTWAKEKEYKDNEVPEVSGDYALKDHPNTHVRVFVHKEKDKLLDSVLPSCVNNDPDSSAITGPAGWKLPSTWSYRLNQASVPSTVGGANLSGMVSGALTSWANASGNMISFSQGANTAVNRARYDGQNIISWGRTSSGTLGVTYTWYYTDTKMAVETDTIMNSRVPWSWAATSSSCPNLNAYDAQNILTHELGHWTGLTDHYDVAYTDNTMYGYGAKGEIKKDTLTTGDSTGVYNLYH